MYDRLYGIGGNDTLIGGAGNDTLIGGNGDLLQGGTGYDTYEFNTGGGADTILDSDGLGGILLNGTQLTGQSAVYKGNNQWVDGSTQYQYDPNRKILTVTIGSDSITIDNFDLVKATDPTQGYLGIHLALALSIVAGSGNTAFATANQTADVSNGTIQTFTVNVASYSDVAQTLTDKWGQVLHCSIRNARLNSWRDLLESNWLAGFTM